MFPHTLQDGRGIAGSRIRPTCWIVQFTISGGYFQWFLERGISANAVSLRADWASGLLPRLPMRTGGLWPLARAFGLLLSMAWLVADGLDGMIARTTGPPRGAVRAVSRRPLRSRRLHSDLRVPSPHRSEPSRRGRLEICAGVLHALQSNLYESERARFHQPLQGRRGL